MTADQMTPGLIYSVRFEDCCISGQFTGVFMCSEEGTLCFEGFTLEGVPESITEVASVV